MTILELVKKINDAKKTGEFAALVNEQLSRPFRVLEK